MHGGLDKEQLQKSLIKPDFSIAKAIALLDKAGTGILLAIDENLNLMGVITDGDIRRAILREVALECPCSEIMNTQPLVTDEETATGEIIHLLDHGHGFAVNHLPVVNSEGKLVDLILRRDLTSKNDLGVSAVVMAGGYGTRLHPLTVNIPKPLLKVGDRPILERIINQLKDAGVSKINMSTHFQASKIMEYFGDGNKLGVNIDYIEESTPLGTAGVLGLMDKPQETILLINGDIMTDMDFQAMLSFHREHRASLTVAVHKYEMEIPFGVLEIDDVLVKGLQEKPSYRFFINAGIYLIEPEAYGCIPEQSRYNMTDLIQKLIENKKRVVSFPIHELWLDIGCHRDLEKARGNYGKRSDKNNK